MPDLDRHTSPTPPWHDVAQALLLAPALVMALVLAPLIVSPASSRAETATAAGLLDGRWALQGSKTVFRFQPCGPATCGVLETSERILANADVRDINNHDPQLRTRRLQGLETLQGLSSTGPGAWRGKIYLPGSGATYGVSVTRTGPDTLTARGCAAPLLCQTSTLKRLP